MGKLIDKIKDSLTLWLGSVEAHADWQRQEDWFASATAEDLAKLGPEVYAGADEDEFGDFGYMVSRSDNTAIIEVRGKLVPGNSWINKYTGRTGYGEIQEAFAAVAQATGITQALMRINSTGGSSNGVDETTKFIKSFDKNVMPVYAHTAGNMLSAAMWIGSAARKRWATEMASVGSIGVIAIFMEYTEMMKKQGIGVHVFREGDKKALVNPYEKLTKKAKTYVETQMAQINTFFVQALSTNLGLTEAYVRDKIADGSEFFGADAKELGLIDKVSTLDSMLSGLVNKQDSQTIHKFATGANAMTLKKTENQEAATTTLSAEAQAAVSAGATIEEAMLAHPAAEETTDVETEVALVEANAEATETVIEPETPEVVAEQQAPSDGGMSLMIDKLAASQKETAEQLAQVTKLTTELAEANAGATLLRTLASDWCQRMAVGLGLPANAGLETMSSGALATEVARVRDMFDYKLRPGQKVEAASESEEPASQGVVTSITQNRDNAVQFKNP